MFLFQKRTKKNNKQYFFFKVEKLIIIWNEVDEKEFSEISFHETLTIIFCKCVANNSENDIFFVGKKIQVV